MERLFKPITIGTVEMKNRLVVPAISTQYCGRDGQATERYISYLEARAKGGWGLIITENYPVNEFGGATLSLPGLWSDEQIPSHRKLTERVHGHGAKICCQIYHAGRAAHPKIQDGPKVAPSPIRDCTRKDLPRSLTRAEIHTIVEQFGAAALRAKRAGFDMVEIHGAHGYLVSQFLSGFSNKRTDEYGGSLHGRCRFLLEILEEVRGRVGSDFPIQLRISAAEGVDGGLSIGESQATALMAQAAGIAAIHVSQGCHANMADMISPYYVPRAAYAGNAAAVKAVVKIPVIGVGRINDPLIAEAVLASGAMDLVAMGRASLADPDLPRKAQTDSLDDIRYCFGCMQGCIGKGGRRGIRCLANPELGQEFQTPRRLAETPRRILVAGGGIAGCEAAILAAQRGHRVSLLEASDYLGGQWRAAAMPPGKSELNTLLFRQSRQLVQLGVETRLRTPVTEELLRCEEPDLVIVATGGVPFRPPISGIDRPHVVPAADVLTGAVPAGSDIVVVGGGLVGAETADYAAQQGASVTILEMGPTVAGDGEPVPNQFLLRNLRQRRVRVYTEAVCTEIEELGVRFTQGGREHLIEHVNQVILAAGTRPVTELARVCERLGIWAVSVGDAARVKNGMQNIWEAFDLAAKL